MTDKKDMATEGTEDRLKGAAKQAEGRIRNAVGGLTGDTGEQVKGKGQEIKGKAQDAVGTANLHTQLSHTGRCCVALTIDIRVEVGQVSQLIVYGDR